MVRPQAPEEDTATCRTLIVDDDENDALLTMHALERTVGPRHEVTAVESLGEALAVAREQSFDLVLTDLGLPDASGLESLVALQTLLPDVPIISLSGQEDETVVREAIGAGAQDYIAKGDVRPDTLGRSIRYARDRKRGEVELRKAKEHAEAAARAKAMFLATMSHEIRTPMNGVLGTAELLFESPLNDEQRGLVQILQRSGQALLTIINDILDYSKIEAGRMTIAPEPARLHGIFQESVATLDAIAAQQMVRLALHIDEQLPPWVSVDATRLRQILLNLTGNAIKFTANGSVTVKARNMRYGNGPGMRIEVQDTGVGIAEEDQARLFDRFTQVGDLQSRAGGTGLGLAICYQLTQLMGGRMGVESTLGEGSIFWLELPLVAACDPGIGSTETIAPPSSEILAIVADDNAVNRMLAKRMLEKAGCKVLLAENGREVLEIADRQPPDIVFMDCHMPVLDGFSATRKLRGQLRFAKTPIVALSASAMEAERRACFDVGMDEFVAKPVTRKTFEEVLRRRVWRRASG